MRTWPKAGCSTASATMASSIFCGTRFFSTGFLRRSPAVPARRLCRRVP
jgi:hypothetical protein